MGRSVADGAPRVCARLDSTGVRDARVHPSREASGVVVVVAASERASEEGLVIYPRVVVEEEAARGIDATRHPHRIHSFTHQSAPCVSRDTRCRIEWVGACACVR